MDIVYDIISEANFFRVESGELRVERAVAPNDERRIGGCIFNLVYF